MILSTWCRREASQKEGGPIGHPRTVTPWRVIGISEGKSDIAGSSSCGMKSRDLDRLRDRPNAGPSVSTISREKNYRSEFDARTQRVITRGNALYCELSFIRRMLRAHVYCARRIYVRKVRLARETTFTVADIIGSSASGLHAAVRAFPLCHVLSMGG